MPNSEKISKADLITIVQDQLLEENPERTKKEIACVIDTCIDALEDQLVKGNSVSIYKFGSFRVADSAARTVRNPSTGGTVDVPAKKRVKFKASSSLNARVDNE